MPYIDDDYIDAMIGGAEVRRALFTDEGNYNAAASAALIVSAQSVVDAALSHALEASVPLTGTVPEIVRQATFGQYVLLAHGRKRLGVPEQWATAVALAEGIRSGAVPVPELAASLGEAKGGITGTDPTAKPLNLSVGRLTGW